MAMYRRWPPAKRVEVALRMTQDADAIAKQGIRMRHPDYSDAQVTDALRRIILGDDLFRAAWPDRTLVSP